MEEIISRLQIEPFLYHPIFMYGLCALAIIYVIYLSSINANGRNVLAQGSSIYPATALTAVVIIFIGFRPVSVFFGDMTMYAHYYNNILGEVYEIDADVNTHSEWLWEYAMQAFKFLGMTDVMFFAFCALIYVGCMYWACYRIMPRHLLPAMLFCLCAFSFWGYAVNGIRNGVGSSIALVALTYMLGGKREKIIAAILFFLTLGIHRSLLLPAACAVASAFFIKKPKTAIYIWIASIAFSLLFGNAIADIFAALGFDDRMNDYLRAGVDDEAMEEFSDTGFRWDFLLYSAIPIWFMWYVSIKRRLRSKTYEFLACTYIFANAFWILVIRSSFSNRFAYLSWFIYPLVIAYPLLEMKIWKRQHLKLALALLAYEAFTFVMFLLGK